MPSQTIDVAANGEISFFFTPHLLYPSSVDGHVDCFHIWQSAFISCEYVYLEMELVVHMVVSYLVFEEPLYHSSGTISHSLLQCTRAPISTSSLIPSALPSLLPPSFRPSFSFSSSSFPFPSFSFSFLSAYLL